jgi:hypothetical protein
MPLATSLVAALVATALADETEPGWNDCERHPGLSGDRGAISAASDPSRWPGWN